MMIEWRSENQMTKRIRRERRTSFLLLDMLLRIDMKWLTFDRTLTEVSSLSHIILMTSWRTNCQICIHSVFLTFELIDQSLHTQQCSFISVLIILFFDVHSRKTIDNKSRRWSFIVHTLKTTESSFLSYHNHSINCLSCRTTKFCILLLSNLEVLTAYDLKWRRSFDQRVEFFVVKFLEFRFVYFRADFHLIFFLVDKQNIRHIFKSFAWVFATNSEKKRSRKIAIIEQDSFWSDSIKTHIYKRH